MMTAWAGNIYYLSSNPQESLENGKHCSISPNVSRNVCKSLLLFEAMQGFTFIFQLTWQVGQPYVTICLTFEIFTWEKGGIYV